MVIKPTILQRFFAWWWCPCRFGLGFFRCLGLCWRLRSADPLLPCSQYVLLFLLAIVVAPALLFLVGILVSFPIIGSIYYARELANGGPFKVGDRVYIIAGRHKGKVTRVYSMWQGGTVRLELGEKEKETFKDIFGGNEVLRADDVRKEDD